MSRYLGAAPAVNAFSAPGVFGLNDIAFQQAMDLWDAGADPYKDNVVLLIQPKAGDTSIVDRSVNGTNLLLRSNDFANASWTKPTGQTATAGTATGPDGTLSMSTLATDATANAFQGMSQTFVSTAAAYVFSFYCRQGVSTSVGFDLLDLSAGNTLVRGCFSFATETVTKQADLSVGSLGNVGFVNLGGGLYRVWVTGSYPAGGTDAVVIYADQVGNVSNGDSAVVYGAQLELGATPGPYVPTTTATRAPKTVSINGNAALSGAKAFAGGASVSFDGATDYLSIPDSSDWTFGTGNFVIDVVLRLNSALTANDTFCGQYYDSGNLWKIGLSGSTGQVRIISIIGSSTNFECVSSSNVVVPGAITHLSFVRSGTSMLLYVNQTQAALSPASAGTTNLSDLSTPLIIGYDPLNAGRDIDGNIYALRITKGTDRGYTGATIPALRRPFPLHA